MKNLYFIPQIQQRWGVAEIEADNLQEAIEKAYTCLPPVTEYIDDSQEIDWDGISIRNEDLSASDKKFLRTKTKEVK